MNLPNLAMVDRDTASPARTLERKSRNCSRRRSRWHDPMLVLNMLIFNSKRGWKPNPESAFPSRDNVWC
jgi:hypothetical protein